MKYRKLPVIIDAVQWQGYIDEFETPFDKFGDTEPWLKEAFEKGIVTMAYPVMLIKTLEGTMQVSAGDYIIKGINGELYPCKPDIFKKTYERADGLTECCETCRFFYRDDDCRKCEKGHWVTEEFCCDCNINSSKMRCDDWEAK